MAFCPVPQSMRSEQSRDTFAQPRVAKLSCHCSHHSFCISQGCVAERWYCLAYHHVWICCLLSRPSFTVVGSLSLLSRTVEQAAWRNTTWAAMDSCCVFLSTGELSIIPMSVFRSTKNIYHVFPHHLRFRAYRLRQS